MVAVFVLDKHKRCRFINAVAEFLTGVPVGQAVGRPFGELVWRGTPFTFEQSHLARALGSDHPEEGEATLTDNTGQKRPFAFRVMPLDEDVSDAIVVELFDLGGETGAARALRESERRLRLATEATGIGIWDVNAVTDQRRWSAEMFEILGLPPDTTPSTELFSSLLHPDDRQWVDAMYAELYATPGDGMYSAEFRIVRANDGEVRWVAATGTVTYDAEGKPLRAVGTLRDIHERREHEAALKASEERLRIALSAGRMGLWRHDFKTGTQTWDATQYAILGVDPTTPASYEQFIALIHPDDRRKVRLDPDRLPPVGKFLDWEARITRPDGQVRWISAHAIILTDESGEPVEMIGVNRDITSQKEAALALKVNEERLRLALEANDVGTWDYDIVSGKQQWSSQYKKLWGLPADAESDSELVRKLVDPADWAAVEAAWERACDPAQSTGRIAFEFLIRRADTGERRWCSFAGNIFFDAARTRAIRALGIMMDTTSRRAVEERQRRVLRELHHRVNNNLAIVQAVLSQTLRSSLKPAEAFDRIQARLMCLARIHELIGRSEWGEVSLPLLISTEIEFAGGGLDRVHLDGEPLQLDSASATTLGLVFHELASNAARYGALSTPDGRIDITWKNETSSGRRIDITWQESGVDRVRLSSREGFGFRLIKGSVGGVAGGRADVEVNEEGLRWGLEFPLPPPQPDELSDISGAIRAGPSLVLRS